MSTYKLDPAHYYTSPGLSWDALLKKSKVELELLTDYDMHLFIERGMRGGISMVSKRYAKANNPYISSGKFHDKSKPNSYIQYLDANNLYGWAMSQALPTSNFKSVSSDKNYDDIINHPSNSTTGYILEIDLEYPQDIHESHNDYPVAPDSLVVQQEWM